MTIEAYYQYGENLATNLPEIGHSPAKRRFVRIEDPSKPDEFLSAASNYLDSESTVLVWEMFTEQPQSANNRSYTSLIEGSFVVMKKGKSVGSRLAVYEQCRPLALQLLKQMVLDGITGPLEQQRIVPVIDGNGEGIGPFASTWYGWSFIFQWRVPLF